MGYPGRHNIYEATIRRMVTEAIAQQEQEFRDRHGSDTDEQLLTYLRTCAIRLHHTPWPDEIVGGRFLEERFGSWNRALALAKLSAPRTVNQNKNFARFQEETEKQKEIYRQKKAEKKLRAQQRLQEQQKKQKGS